MNQSERIYLKPEEAVKLVVERFPLEDYIDLRSNSHLSTAKTVCRHLAPGAKILDFGCGPCDKTAVLQAMGFECSAYDDLQDAWHAKSEMQSKILAFAENVGINFTLARPGADLPYSKEYFDMVILNDVLEHLHDSPRELLNKLLEFVKPGGLLLVTVPNAGNIRKRVVLLMGGTNYQRFDSFFWYPGQWRGHVREYVRGDLLSLSNYLGLEVLELHGCDQMLNKVMGALRGLYVAVSSVMNGWKDSWTLVARKRPGWKAQINPSPDIKISRATKYLYGE